MKTPLCSKNDCPLFCGIGASIICLGLVAIYLLCNNANWTAIGALGTYLAALTSFGVSFLLYRLQRRMADNEQKNKELELKIVLFEKRFQVYNCIKTYIGVFSIIEHNEGPMTMPDGSSCPLNEFVGQLLFSSRIVKGIDPPNWQAIKLGFQDQKYAELAKFCFEDQEIHTRVAGLVEKICGFSLRTSDYSREDVLTEIHLFNETRVMERIEAYLRLYC